MTDQTDQTEITDRRPDILDEVSRRTLLKASGVGAGGLALGASASPAAAQAETETDGEDSQIANLRVPYLDPDTLEAELNGETLQAESFEERRPGSTTYVGESASHPGIFAAVSYLAEETTPTAGDQQPPDVVVYICGDEVGTRNETSLWFSGAFEEGGTTFNVQFEGGGTGLTDEQLQRNPEVKLAFVDGTFLGTAILPDVEDPITFVAAEATDVGGLYGTESEQQTTNGDPLPVRWVMLANGRQRGGVCIGVSAFGVCVGVRID